MIFDLIDLRVDRDKPPKFSELLAFRKFRFVYVALRISSKKGVLLSSTHFAA